MTPCGENSAGPVQRSPTTSRTPGPEPAKPAEPPVPRGLLWIRSPASNRAQSSAAGIQPADGQSGTGAAWRTQRAPSRRSGIRTPRGTASGTAAPATGHHRRRPPVTHGSSPGLGASRQRSVAPAPGLAGAALLVRPPRPDQRSRRSWARSTVGRRRPRTGGRVAPPPSPASYADRIRVDDLVPARRIPPGRGWRSAGLSRPRSG